MISTTALALLFGSSYIGTLIFCGVTGNIPGEIILGIPGLLYVILKFR